MYVKTKILTIILHSIILIELHHGIGILIMMDIAVIPIFFENGISNGLEYGIEDNVMKAGIYSILGKIFLILSLFIRKNSPKNIITIISVLLLWVSFLFLIYGDSKANFIYQFTFWTSLPFLICSVTLIFFIIKNKLWS